MSFWVKVDGKSTEKHIAVSADNNNPSGNQVKNWLASIWSNYEWGTRVGGDTVVYFTPDAKFLDPSAWMHAVFSYSNNIVTLWINGQLIGTTNNLNSFLTTGDYYFIGAEGATAAANNQAGGIYLADYQFVDGTALNQYAFGKYDDNDKWIPIEYEGNYGNNGFHLTFQPD